MRSKGDWLSAREAVQLLDVKLATLYSYASRGLVESVPSAVGRGRLYAASDVERLKARHDARAGHSAVAAAALRWGEPTFTTSISDIRADGPYYRGVSALTLIEQADSFEAVAELLWTGLLPERVSAAPVPAQLARKVPRRQPLSIARLAADVAELALHDARRGQLSAPDDLVRARWLLGWLAGRGRATAGARAGAAARLYASLWTGSVARPGAVSCLDRALILCADHELNVSTLAARAAASAGADLYACLGAALHVLSGAHHGGVSARVEAVVDEVLRVRSAPRLVSALLSRGEAVPGFGHRLYPAGDPRCSALLALAQRCKTRSSRRLDALYALGAAMHEAKQPAPNLDFGLVAFCTALGLLRGSAGLIFAVGRSAGWVAHVFEQRAQGFVLRPRARYVPG
jgi:citrate synthase